MASNSINLEFPDIDAEHLQEAEVELELLIRNVNLDEIARGPTGDRVQHLRGLLAEETANNVDRVEQFPFVGTNADAVAELLYCQGHANPLRNRLFMMVAAREWADDSLPTLHMYRSRLRHYYDRAARLIPRRDEIAEGVLDNLLRDIRTIFVQTAPYVDIGVNEASAQSEAAGGNLTTNTGTNGRIEPPASPPPVHNSTTYTQAGHGDPNTTTAGHTPRVGTQQPVGSDTEERRNVRSDAMRRGGARNSVRWQDLQGGSEPNGGDRLNERWPQHSEENCQNFGSRHSNWRGQNGYTEPGQHSVLSVPLFPPERDDVRNWYQYPSNQHPFNQWPQCDTSRHLRYNYNVPTQPPYGEYHRNVQHSRENMAQLQRTMHNVDTNPPPREPNHHPNGSGRPQFGYTTRFGMEQDEPFCREANQANTHEQQALRRWMQNKYFDGETEDKNLLNTEDFLGALRDYQAAQQVSDMIILRNVGQTMIKQAKTWWLGRQKWIADLDQFEKGVRARFAPQTQDLQSIIDAVHRREQGETESLNSYVDSMLALMAKAPQYWTEENQIDRIIRSTNQQCYHFFVGRNFKSMDQLLAHCSDLSRKQQSAKPRASEPKRWVDFRKRVNVTEANAWHRELLEQGGDVSDTEEMLNEMEIDAIRKFVAAERQRKAKQQATVVNSGEASAAEAKPRVPEEIYRGQIGEKPVRCYNCLYRGHTHYDCPFALGKFCWSCGKPDIHVNDCESCKNKPRKPSQPKNEQSSRGGVDSI